MKYYGICSEDKRTRTKYRCPIKSASRKELKDLPAECPVQHPSLHTGKCYGCTAYIDLNGDIRSQVQRNSKHFKNTFDLRTGVERYFSRLGPREIEETNLYNYRSIRNQMTISHLTLNLVAVAAAIVLDMPDKIRSYKTFADNIAA